MIRSIVLDEVDFSGKVPAQNHFEIRDVSVGIEDVLEMVEESRTVKFDRAEDFEGVALSQGRYFGLMSSAGPCLVQRGVLPKAGFVLEKDRRVLAQGFFKGWGNDNGPTSIGGFYSLGPTFFSDVERRNPSHGEDARHGQGGM